MILEPGKTYKREDGTVGNYYNAKKLYDISQTTMSDTTIQSQNMKNMSLIRALVSTSGKYCCSRTRTDSG